MNETREGMSWSITLGQWSINTYHWIAGVDTVKTSTIPLWIFRLQELQKFRKAEKSDLLSQVARSILSAWGLHPCVQHFRGSLSRASGSWDHDCFLHPLLDGKNEVPKTVPLARGTSFLYTTSCSKLQKRNVPLQRCQIATTPVQRVDNQWVDSKGNVHARNLRFNASGMVSDLQAIRQ